MSRLEIATAVYLQQSRTAFFSELIVRRLSMRHSVANEALSLAFVVHFLGRIIHKQPVQTHKVTSVRLTSSPPASGAQTRKTAWRQLKKAGAIVSIPALMPGWPYLIELTVRLQFGRVRSVKL